MCRVEEKSDTKKIIIYVDKKEITPMNAYF